MRISFFKHRKGKSLSSFVPENQMSAPIRLQSFMTIHGLEVAGFSSPDFVGAVIGHESVPARSLRQAAVAL
jgi:hypothetical protein